MINSDINKREKILELINESDYLMGKSYYIPYITFVNSVNMGSSLINHFRVESERTSSLYDVSVCVNVENRSIDRVKCSCPQFINTSSCKHIGACLYYYYNELYPTESLDNMKKRISLDVLDRLKRISVKRCDVVKKEINIEIELTGVNESEFYQSYLDLTLKIGFDKLYSCKDRKLSKLLDAINNGYEYEMGKYFMYSPNTCYFDSRYDSLFNYLSILNDNKDYYDTLIDTGDKIKQLLSILKGFKYKLNGYVIDNYIDGFPLDSKLSMDIDDKYVLNFDTRSINVITNDMEYVQIKNILYKLSDSDRVLFKEIVSNEIDELVFDNKDEFRDYVLPVIKNMVNVSDEVDIVIAHDVKARLYFDMYNDSIICDIKMVYDGNVISYFDKDDSIVRDYEYESSVISDLVNNGFSLVKGKYILDGVYNIGKFIDEDIIMYTKKYETYTSSKIKKINIVKKSNISSTFSIGSDGIMSYSFNLGGISNKEIGLVLDSLKENKKYYRLRSGDIIDLYSDTDLQELGRLSSDIDISYDDISNGKGIIPKYRAIYLDSLKKDNYHIIKTNNLFDELIDKFNNYKNSELSLDKDDLSILREYQIEGVKWLYSIDRSGFGGILADEMGLGKSIQTIYYIKQLLLEDSSYKFLIVAPTSLVYNWKNEFDKFGSNLKYDVIVGDKSNRINKINSDINIIITTYGTLKEDIDLYKDKCYRVMIIDEAQNIKNINTDVTKTVKSINAICRLALTGTPIENSIIELWSIFDYIMPGFLSNVKEFEARYRIKDFDDESNFRIGLLNKLVSPFIMRRRKKDVINDLPDKIENNIYVELTKEQKKVYVAELNKVQDEINNVMAEDGISKVRFMILSLLTKLRQICIDPRIVISDYNGGSGKMNEVIDVCKSMVSDGHKILIFTSFKSALELTKSEFTKRGITSYVIDGSVSSKRRMELVNKFNNDDTNVFFIMLKAGGTGLNLTSADVVIHLDLWWNPQAENQATDRAHRIGQDKVVSVIKFICKGTIEEKILELQSKKKILSDKLIDSNDGDNLFSKLSSEDIKELLSFDNVES